MATHELYLGGAANANLSRSQFPSATFNAADAAVKAMKAAAHKGPSTFALTRTLDFKNEVSLADYVSENTIASGDVLNLVVIPKNTILLGVYVEVEEPSAVAGATIAVKVGANVYGTAIDLTTAGSQFLIMAAAAGVTAGAVDLGTAQFNVDPTILTGTLAITDEGDLKGVRIHISPVVIDPLSGQF